MCVSLRQQDTERQTSDIQRWGRGRREGEGKRLGFPFFSLLQTNQGNDTRHTRTDAHTHAAKSQHRSLHHFLCFLLHSGRVRSHFFLCLIHYPKSPQIHFFFKLRTLHSSCQPTSQPLENIHQYTLKFADKWPSLYPTIYNSSYLIRAYYSYYFHIMSNLQEGLNSSAARTLHLRFNKLLSLFSDHRLITFLQPSLYLVLHQIQISAN